MVVAVLLQVSVHVQKATQDLFATGQYVIHHVKMEPLAHKISNVIVLLDGQEMFVMKLFVTHLVEMMETVLLLDIAHATLTGKV